METWTIEGPNYPFLQPAVSPRPLLLRAKARSRARTEKLFSRLPHFGLGVVGTRRPSRRAQLDVQRVIQEISPESGCVIVSGLAFGLDAEAHEASLYRGIPTVAVLASGVERVYPAAHQALAEKILQQGGVLISEQSDDTANPHPHHFLARNRIIAALSKAVWIAEAGYPSGALSTAHWAVEYGIDVYATPFHPSDSAGAGNRRLLEQGLALPLWKAETLRSTWMDLRLREEDSPPPAVHPDLQNLWKLLRDTHRKRGAMTWDELTLLWGGRPGDLGDLVYQLEDLGHVSVDGGWLVFQEQVR